MPEPTRLAVPPRREVETWLRLMALHVLPAFPNWREDGCCLEATRCLVDLAGRRGYRARPLACQTAVFNRMALDLWRRGVPLGDPQWERDGAHSVGIGYGEPRPGRWPGHLVAIVGEYWLLDATLEQADRPAYGIRLAPLAAAVTPAFLRGEERVVTATEQGGVTAIYEARPHDRSFRQAPGWRAEKMAPAVAALQARLAEEYDRAAL